MKIKNADPVCKVAFIGAGYMSSEHAKAFGSITGVQLAGIYSRTRAQAEGLKKSMQIQRVCDSVHQLYEETRADLVVVSVPELATYDVCMDAFRFPWTILVEKPVGFDLRNALDIYDLALKADAKVFVALNRRQYQSTKTVLQDLNSHETGVRLVEVFDQEDMVSALSAGQPEVVVKNWMYANSIHIIDYLNIYCRGKIVDIENIIRWNPADPFIVSAKVTYDSGDIGLYRGIWNAPAPWSVSVTTKDRRWELRPLETGYIQDYGSRAAIKLPDSEVDLAYKPGLKVQAEEAIIAARGQESNLCTLSESIELMKLIAKIYQMDTNE